MAEPPEPVDETRYPRVASYLAALPAGLDSHSRCLAKASLYRSVVDARPLRAADIAGLPSVLRELLREPLPVSAWVPEVHSHAVMLAVCDLAFPDLDAFARFAYLTQRRLFEGRMYRALLRLVSPQMLLRGSAMRWGAFHRGSDLALESAEAGDAVVRLSYPEHLYDAVSRRGLREGLRAALDVSRAVGASVDEIESTPVLTRFRARWNAGRDVR